MTAKEIFEAVLALMFCSVSEGREYEEAFFTILNMRLRETFMLNNALREYREKPPIESVKIIKRMDDTLDCEPELILALPYGIAGILLVDEDTTGMANVYRNDYIGLISDMSRGCEVSAQEV